MSSAAYVVQLLRSHYQGDERGFSAAALAMARRAKMPTVQRQIEELVRSGAQKRPTGGASRGGMAMLLPPAAASTGTLQRLSETTFADLLLPADVQAVFDELVEELEYRNELAERGLRPRSRIILHGPPGNGKTSSACALASAIDVPAYGVSLARLIGSHIGETGSNLGSLFSELRDETVVVLDEVDAIGSSRVDVSDGASAERNATVNVLLTLLDRVQSGIIVATTNRIDILDPALLRRFDESILVPAPTDAQKAKLAARLCERHGVQLVDVGGCSNFDEVSKRVLREARKQVMREIRAMEDSDNGTKETGGNNESASLN